MDAFPFYVFPLLVQSALVTLWLAAAVAAVSMLLGTLLGVVSIRGGGWIDRLVRTYCAIALGIPDLVWLLFMFYGLSAIGLQLPAPVAAIAGLSISGTAYFTQLVRGGLYGIPHGQYQACAALGFGEFHIYRRLILPQVFSYIRDPLTSLLTNIVKHTSLASVVTVSEISSRTGQLIAATSQPLEMLSMTVMIYVVFNSVLLFANEWLPKSPGLR